MIQISPAVFATLDHTPKGLQTALQHAIELEHATIPPYLYALYSIRPESVRDGRNATCYALLRSVVLEEMQHMVSACNLLNAVGGKPAIDTEKFVPPYPGPLPGSVENQLIVRLRRFSIDQVRDVFMEIEEPEPGPRLTDGGTTADRGLTIGAFYQNIANHIAEMGASIFTGDRSRQVTELFGGRRVVAVTDLATARQAIDVIVEQGEGSSSSPFDDPGDTELAHYYKFKEIVRGRRLILHPGGSSLFKFAGDPISFDPNGVWPLVDDPRTETYEAGSQARRASDIFNYTYTNILKVLHRAVTGEPGLVTDSVRLMESLRYQAVDLMSMALPSGEHAGPTFEYQPVCP